MALLQDFDDLWPAVFHDDTGCRGVDRAHIVAPRSSRIASCFLELEKVNQDLESKLRDDFHSILNSMDNLSISPARHSASPPKSPARSSSALNSSFAISAYSWLIENVANPYPSSTVKASLAQEHNCTLSAVNSWFINTRRRIGWTSLCRDYFNNCRADALDAAHRAFVNEDPTHPLSAEVAHAFVRLRVAAEGLYSSTLTKNILSCDLDSVVKDLTDLDATPSDGRRHCKRKKVLESPKASEMELKNKTRYFYPSSNYSSSSSPVPALDASLTDYSEEEDVSPPRLAGRKRRLSCSESPHFTALLPTKRSRHLCFNPCSPVEAFRSSQKASEQVENPCSRETPQCSTETRASHQQGPSDTDSTEIPKCHQRSITGPQLPAILDALPLSALESDQTMDEWLNSNFHDLFSLPPPVDVIAPDLSAQWEVELFNNYSIPQELQKQPFELLNGLAKDEVSVSTDLSVFDEFLRSLEHQGLVAPSEAIDSADSVLNSVAQYPSFSPEPTDWAALLKTQTCEPALDSIFNLMYTNPFALPETDFSVLQLPQ